MLDKFLFIKPSRPLQSVLIKNDFGAKNILEIYIPFTMANNSLSMVE